VVCGFARSFGQRLPDGQRVEWVKPVMFTAGESSSEERRVGVERERNSEMIERDMI
jgi:hypothetical protein